MSEDAIATTARRRHKKPRLGYLVGLPIGSNTRANFAKMGRSQLNSENTDNPTQKEQTREGRKIIKQSNMSVRRKTF